jgi:hypothetical protein
LTADGYRQRHTVARRRTLGGLLLLLLLAALATFVIVVLSSPQIERLVDLVWLKLQVLLEGG